MALRLLVAVAFLCLIAALWAVWPFSVDDSYILAQYARRLAAGEGYTFRPGPPTDGVTGPLWLVPLVVLSRLGLDPALASKALGGLCTVIACAIVVVRLSRRAVGLASAAWACVLMLSSMPLLCWSSAGLETAAAGLCATLLASTVTRSRGPSAWALVPAAAVPWLRPELVPYAGALVLYAWFRDARIGRRIALAAALSLAAVLAFRWCSFGHLLPMAAAAKPPALGHGASYVLTSGLRLSTVLLVITLGYVARVSTSRERVLCLSLLVHAVAVLLAGGDWMPGMRLFAPVACVLAMTLAPLLARRALRSGKSVLALGTILILARMVETVGQIAEARRGGFELTRTAEALIDALRDADGAIVALDVGAVAYGLSQPVIDLGGLTEPQVAYARGGHLAKEVDSAWLRAQRPRRIVLHSRERPRIDAEGHVRWFAGFPVERRVLGMPWVLTHYRVARVLSHTDAYHYLIFEERPGPISAVMSRTTDLVRDPAHAPDLRRLAPRRVLAP